MSVAIEPPLSPELPYEVPNSALRRNTITDRTPGRPIEDMLEPYLREIRTFPLLTAEEEIELAEIIEEGRVAQIFFEADIADGVLPVDAVEPEVVRAGHAARECFIMSSQRLVVSIARTYTGRGLELMDLIQEGNIGLFRAVDKFDPEKGFRFSSYATWWIDKRIKRAIEDTGRAIRRPVHVAAHLAALHNVRKLVQVGIDQTEVPIDTLAEHLQQQPEQVQTLLRLEAQKPIDSLERIISKEENGLTLVETIPDVTNTASVDEMVHRLGSKTLVDALLTNLDVRERRIIELLYDLNGVGQTYTLEEIGKELDLTKQRIGSLKTRAVEKIIYQFKHFVARGMEL